MKPANVAKLCMQGSDFYADAMKLMQLETLRPLWPKVRPCVFSNTPVLSHSKYAYIYIYLFSGKRQPYTTLFGSILSFASQLVTRAPGKRQPYTTLFGSILSFASQLVTRAPGKRQPYTTLFGSILSFASQLVTRAPGNCSWQSV